MSVDPFLDTNILVYAFELEGVRTTRAKEIVAEGGRLSVQVLNEFVSVCLRKLRIDWAEIHARLDLIDELLAAPSALSPKTQRSGLLIAERYRINIYDALIVASALEQGCSTIFTEDLQHGALIEGVLIQNPFRQ